MRVSTSQQYNSYSARIRQAQSDVYRAQQEVMTGKKQDLFTVDPAGAGFVVRSKDLQGAFTQYLTNLRAAKDYAGNTESSLGNMHDLMTQVKTLSLQAANSSTDQAARNAIAKQIGDLQQRFVQETNAKGSSGQYLFAGQNSGVKPFALNPAGTALVYGGDTNPVLVEVGPGETMTVNQELSAQFIQMYSHLETLKGDLASGNFSAISDVDIANLDQDLIRLREQRGEAGAKIQGVKNLETQGQRRIDELANRIADVEDVDLSEAITRMQLAQTAYQAALQVTTMGQKLSLMDYL